MPTRIELKDLRVGMFLERVDGSWLSHTLWRQRFTVDSELTLSHVRNCGAVHCWIDTDKGLAIERLVEAEETLPLGWAATRPRPSKERPDPADEPATLPQEAQRVASLQEFEDASRICTEAKAIVGRIFADLSAGQAPQIEEVVPIVSDVVTSVFQNSEALISLARLKTQDDYTYMHSVSVCALMVAVGRSLGFDAQRCRAFAMAGLFHDVGKALVPLELLNKPGRLDALEFEKVKGHAALGHAMIADSGFNDQDVLDVCLHHHEKIDGTGYPEQLSGDAISLVARMGAVCDVYDAVTSARPYKSAWDPSEALRRMATWKGHFDRSILAALVKAVGIYPVGSVVRLASQRLAVVMANPKESRSKPVVKAFYSLLYQQHIVPELIDLRALPATDSIIARETDGLKRFANLEQLWLGR